MPHQLYIIVVLNHLRENVKRIFGGKRFNDHSKENLRTGRMYPSIDSLQLLRRTYVSASIGTNTGTA